MAKSRRVDNPLRTRPLVTPESGAHARITPIDTRRAEDFFEPDAALVALDTAAEETELSQTRASLEEREQTIQSLESRLRLLEDELSHARESLRQKDIELHSLHSVRIPSAGRLSDSLRQMAACDPLQPSVSLPSFAPASAEPPPLGAAPGAEAPIAPAPSAPPPSSDWQPASTNVGYPVLQHVALALRASTLPPSSRESLAPSQRRAPRKPVEIELEFSEETQFFTGLTQDISEGGVFVATYQIFAIGTRLELSFELPDGTKVNTWGRVRWLREESASGCRPGMGVEFGALSEPVLRAIAQFCEQRPPLYMEV